MKRKLIDLDERTFDGLTQRAVQSGTNLKNYIEDVLEEKALCLEDNGTPYSLTSDREPSDVELAGIMAAAVQTARDRNRDAYEKFFCELTSMVENLVKYEN